MEFKHFSHNHGLVSQHIPQTSSAQCGGCRSPASGNLYVCWKCNYFLHDQCFQAPRSLRHGSHPLHPLTLVPFPTYPSASFICNTCHSPGHGLSYTCSHCDFDIHVHCALLPHHNHVPNPNCNSSQTSLYPPSNPNPQNQPPVKYNLPQINPYPNPVNPTPQNPIPPAVNPVNPPPLPNPSSTFPTYSTVVNTTGTTVNPPVSQPQFVNPPISQPQFVNPPVSQPQVVNPSVSQPEAPQLPQSNNPQPKPSSIIRHFSHPHVLKAMEIDKKNAKICSACECELSGSAYCCTEPYCTFNLHKSCFDSPCEVTHKSHLQHPLKLLTAPPYSDGFTCNACLKEGKAFVYHCTTCTYDLHIDCIQWPDTVIRPDHKHSLALYYSSPAADMGQDVTFICDVCKNPVHEMAWVYYCRECDFGTHLECVASGIKTDTGSSGGGGGGMTPEELIREFTMLQILLGAKNRKNMLDSI